jgi:hypothetical protein
VSLLGFSATARAQSLAGDSAVVSPKIGSADTLTVTKPPAEWDDVRTTGPAIVPVEPPPGATPLMVLAQIEQGWRTGAPEVVVGCLASQIEIVCKHACPPGFYARPQAEFLISDLLHYGDTLDFRLTRFEWKGENAKGQAAWVHRMGTAEQRVEVQFELAKEGDNWRVVRLATN